MKQVWNHILGWLAGRKTYLLAVLLILVVIGFVAFGNLTPEMAATIFLIFVGLFAASFRSALASHQDEVIAETRIAANLMRDVVAHNTKAAVADAFTIYTQGQKLATEVQAEQAAKQKAGTAQ